MCLEILTRAKKLKNAPKPRIAKQDIEVRKCIYKTRRSLIYDLIIDDKVDKWKKGTHYYETTPFKGKDLRDDCLYINGNCFHSYASKIQAENIRQCYDDIRMVIRCIIPKGAKYYYAYDMYASSEIIYP